MHSSASIKSVHTLGGLCKTIGNRIWYRFHWRQSLRSSFLFNKTSQSESDTIDVICYLLLLSLGKNSCCAFHLNGILFIFGYICTLTRHSLFKFNCTQRKKQNSIGEDGIYSSLILSYFRLITTFRRKKCDGRVCTFLYRCDWQLTKCLPFRFSMRNVCTFWKCLKQIFVGKSWRERVCALRCLLLRWILLILFVIFVLCGVCFLSLLLLDFSWYWERNHMYALHTHTSWKFLRTMCSNWIQKKKNRSKANIILSFLFSLKIS